MQVMCERSVLLRAKLLSNVSYYVRSWEIIGVNTTLSGTVILN